MGTHLEMLRVMKFVIDTKHSGLRVQIEREIKIGVFTYFMILIGREILRHNQFHRIHGVCDEYPCLLASKAQRGVTLSSNKAECDAILEAKEIKFIYYLLQAIEIKF
jgi:hypothetical protein